MTHENRTLLIVDDDVPFRERLVRAMRGRGADAIGVGDHASAQAARTLGIHRRSLQRKLLKHPVSR